MAPSPSSDATLSEADVERLLDLADAAIVNALAGRRATEPALAELPASLHARVGVFVTLTVGGELNGCIGLVEGTEPLGCAVPRLALSAAFEDPRLPALRPGDYADLAIELSLLSALEPIEVGSYAELVAAVRPGTDGIVVKEGWRQGLFLPQVWDQLPEPAAFLTHLWHKAGLRPGTWTRGTRVHRFSARKHHRHA